MSMTPSVAAHDAVLAAGRDLSEQHPTGVNTEVIGMTAWARLSETQRMAVFPQVLASFVSHVHAEHNASILDEDATDPTHTYLEPGDVADTWQEALGPADEWECVSVDKAAMLRILSEIELLQHRLSMRDEEGTS